MVKTLESAIKGKGRISFPWLIVLSTRHMWLSITSFARAFHKIAGSLVQLAWVQWVDKKIWRTSLKFHAPLSLRENPSTLVPIPWYKICMIFSWTNVLKRKLHPLRPLGSSEDTEKYLYLFLIITFILNHFKFI